MAEKIDKQKFIANALKRLPEKVAEDWWKTRKLLDMQNDDLRRLERYRAESVVVHKVNMNLEEILKENGIKPIPLVVTFKTKECRNCDLDGYDLDCSTCRPGIIHPTETMSFFSFSVDEESLYGINAELEKINLKAISVVDRRTGRVLWERKDDDDEEEEGEEQSKDS